MFAELDSFGYQSSPLAYNGDSDSFISVGATKAAEFPTFRLDPVPVEWDAFDNTTVFDGQLKFDPKKVSKSKCGKTSDKKDPKMIVFKPFQSTDSTELTVKMLRVWLNGTMPIEEISRIDLTGALAMGL